MNPDEQRETIKNVLLEFDWIQHALNDTTDTWANLLAQTITEAIGEQ